MKGPFFPTLTAFSKRSFPSFIAILQMTRFTASFGASPLLKKTIAECWTCSGILFHPSLLFVLLTPEASASRSPCQAGLLHTSFNAFPCLLEVWNGLLHLRMPFLVVRNAFNETGLKQRKEDDTTHASILPMDMFLLFQHFLPNV